MKAGELIIGVFPNMRCKGCHRAGIARFQLGKGLEITPCRRICVLLGPKGFEKLRRKSIGIGAVAALAPRSSGSETEALRAFYRRLTGWRGRLQ